MDTLETTYGVLSGIVWAEFYEDGSVESCALESFNQITTNWGTFVPQYEEDPRRKQSRPVTFYPSGSLKSVVLQKQQEIPKKIGTIPAEQITFYEDGSIKRVFPLNGKITGFWTVENEYELVTEIEIQTSFGLLKSKILGVCFYPDGALKSLTFWPQDSVQVPTTIGLIETRTGLSFHPQGAIQSLEPKHPISVDTPIGKMTAFHANVAGIHGDANSLCFSPEGQLRSLATSTDHITITDQQGNQFTLQPGLQPSCNINIMDIVPLWVEFTGSKVRFNRSPELEYGLEQCSFKVESKPMVVQERCEASLTDE